MEETFALEEVEREEGGNVIAIFVVMDTSLLGLSCP